MKRPYAWASAQWLAEGAEHGDVEAEAELDLRDEYANERWDDDDE